MELCCRRSKARRSERPRLATSVLEAIGGVGGGGGGGGEDVAKSRSESEMRACVAFQCAASNSSPTIAPRKLV